MSGIFQVASLPSRGMSPLRPTRPPPSAAVFGAIAKGDDHEAPFVAELLRFLESRGLFVPKGLIEAFEATASPRTAEELAEGVGRLEKGVPLIFAGRLRAASWGALPFSAKGVLPESMLQWVNDPSQLCRLIQSSFSRHPVDAGAPLDQNALIQ